VISGDPLERGCQCQRQIDGDNGETFDPRFMEHRSRDRIARDEGAAGLSDLSVTLSLGLAQALERIADEQGLAAADLAEVWFAE
jgi:hypothetical protein